MPTVCEVQVSGRQIQVRSVKGAFDPLPLRSLTLTRQEGSGQSCTKCDRHDRAGGIKSLVPAPGLLELVNGSGGPSHNGLVVKISTNLHGQPIGGFIPAPSVFL